LVLNQIILGTLGFFDLSGAGEEVLDISSFLIISFFFFLEIDVIIQVVVNILKNIYISVYSLIYIIIYINRNSSCLIRPRALYFLYLHIKAKRFEIRTKSVRFTYDRHGLHYTFCVHL
jgi:hypothetical protein